MKIIENRKVDKLYCIMIEHPSRDHVVIPNEIIGDLIYSVKDNAVSKLEAVLFTEESDALYFAQSINTKCKVKIVSLSDKMLHQIENYGLLVVSNLINPYVNCYLVNKSLEQELYV